ncbi:hypothetical protein EBT25_13480 [bacterium]|nr:hypothetical protein [bacterium]
MQTFSLFTEAATRSTLQHHRKLNPKFWDARKRLDPKVKAKLLEIARVWQKFANIENSNIIDIVLTGGNANYNYTKHSDLDIHLIVDYNKVSCEDKIVFDYFMSKKSLWAAYHTNIRVRGYPVELFAEDKTAKPRPGQGVFSLLKNRWIQEPELVKFNIRNDTLLQQKVAFYMKEIDNMVSGKQSVDAANDLKDRLRLMRAAAIEMGGEFSFENLVFKDLRNRGYLNKLSNYLTANKEKQLSLK